MNRPHLLRVEEEPAVFAPLLAALGGEGLRVGWLELAEPAPLPPALEQAAALGVLRAVAVGEAGSVAVKPRRGAPVLEDLLREHFLGCRLVLVRAWGEGVAAPRLAPAGEGSWRVEAAGGAAEVLSSEELAARLRRPRPWG